MPCIMFKMDIGDCSRTPSFPLSHVTVPHGLAAAPPVHPSHQDGAPFPPPYPAHFFPSQNSTMSLIRTLLLLSFSDACLGLCVLVLGLRVGEGALASPASWGAASWDAACTHTTWGRHQAKGPPSRYSMHCAYADTPRNPRGDTPKTKEGL